MKKLGFGTMRLPLIEATDPKSIDYEVTDKMFDHFLEKGFTYVDSAYLYHEKMSEIAVRECLVKRHPRESFVLATKMPTVIVSKTEQYKEYFEDQLSKCGVEYFDYYLLHNMGKDRCPKTEQLGGFEFVERMKAEGKIRKLGFSFHDDAKTLDEILTKHKCFDFVQLQINYLDWESSLIQSRKNYEVACKHGLKIVVMEPVKGGKLANLPENALKVLRDGGLTDSPASYAIRFAAGLENVMMVLSGMSNMAQMEENTSFMQDFKPLTEHEREVLAAVAQEIGKVTKVPCTSCGYCMEVCPKNINVPGYFSLLNAFEITKAKTNMYFERIRMNHGSAISCLKCGKCEKNCPQHIEIRKYLDEFVELYEKPAGIQA